MCGCSSCLQSKEQETGKFGFSVHCHTTWKVKQTYVRLMKHTKYVKPRYDIMPYIIALWRCHQCMISRFELNFHPQMVLQISFLTYLTPIGCQRQYLGRLHPPEYNPPTCKCASICGSSRCLIRYDDTESENLAASYSCTRQSMKWRSMELRCWTLAVSGDRGASARGVARSEIKACKIESLIQP